MDRDFPSLGVPILLFHGRADERVPIEGSRDFASQQDDATLVELDDDHGLVASLPIMQPRALAFLEELS